MYEFYRKDTDYGRTVCRREVDIFWFEVDILRALATMFFIASIVSGGVQYAWIATVSFLGIVLGLGITNSFVAQHRYNKYIKELKQSYEQEELEEIYNQETEKLNDELKLLEDKPLSEMCLYLIDKRNKIKRDLEQ